MNQVPENASVWTSWRSQPPVTGEAPSKKKNAVKIAKPKVRKVPTSKMPRYVLAPATVPGQFVSSKRPSLEIRSSLKMGDSVKLAFVRPVDSFGAKSAIPNSPFTRPIGSERLWVSITKVLGEGRYHGTLTNQPVFTPTINRGDEVVFDASNIIDIQAAPVPKRPKVAKAT